MKKLPFYLTLSIAVAAIAALVITWIQRKNFTLTTANQSGGDELLGSDADVKKAFNGFDYNKLLNTSTDGGEMEIKLLQRLINAYYGGPTDTVGVSGTFTAATRNAVMDITGKQETSIYEFYYMYFAPMRGWEKGQAIIDSMSA